MWRPSVSVVMCTYNGEKFLREQINSILAQSYPVKELLIFDDQSTDGTVAIIQSYLIDNPFIKFYRNPKNLGYNANFEQALLKASCEVIAISDQDDIWHPQKLEKIIAAFQDAGVVLVHSAAASIKDNIISCRAAQHRNHFQGSDPKPLFFTNQISGHTMVFRRSLLPIIMPIPKGMYYDWWIAVSAASNGKVKAINECLVMHRLHNKNTFFQKEKQDVVNQPKLLEILNFLTGIKGLKNDDKAFLQCFRQILLKHIEEKPFFNFSLFCFLWRSRRCFFGYKKRVIPAFTYIKYSLLYALKQF